MTQQEFTAALAENRTRAEEIAAALPRASDEETEALVREFISCKYFLTAEEMLTDDLIQLGDRSTEKLADLQKGGCVMPTKTQAARPPAPPPSRKYCWLWRWQGHRHKAGCR